MNSDELLLHLCQFGNPRVSRMTDGGWHASIEMHVSAAGTTFSIKSEFDHPLPSVALELVVTRVVEALAYWKDKSETLKLK